MSPLRIGSLCSGYGGLDMAVQHVFGGELAWVADPDLGAAAILKHHHPKVPNLGDITKTNWEDVPRVDLLCGGFPCQDISYAGLGAGIKKGTRSGLWFTFADAISALRPRIVVLENVRGIVVRRPGLDVVLADLARLGFDAEWTCLRAADIGAPHGRARWFLVARDTNRVAGEATFALGWGSGAMDEPGAVKRTLRPDRVPATADANRDALRQQPVPESRRGSASVAELPGVEWGPYGPAILCWEQLLGRPAPVLRLPTGRNGAEELNPVFVEWMMGLPAGHVTGVPDLDHGAQLRALGNGVVPQQAAAALRLLLPAVLNNQREPAA